MAVENDGELNIENTDEISLSGSVITDQSVSAESSLVLKIKENLTFDTFDEKSTVENAQTKYDNNDDSGMDAGNESDSVNKSKFETKSDLIVLDPEHPLMKRFQQAYKEHLTKLDQKITYELKDLVEEQLYVKRQREELGVNLYGVQQELAKQQLVLEKRHNLFNECSHLRKQTEKQLTETKTIYTQVLNSLQNQRKKANELQAEVEKTTLNVQYLESAKDDVRSNISVLKRGSKKTETEVLKAQQLKKKQDFLLNKIVVAVDRLESDIAMYDTQYNAQKEETKSALRTLTEASTELEAIEVEKKQLLHEWNNSLMGLKKRDEACAAIQEAYNLQNKVLVAVETEMDGYKKQILKAQEQNEHITYLHNRIENDINMLKKNIQISKNKEEALRIEYSTYSHTYQETKQFLIKAEKELALKENELLNLKKQIEQDFLEKVKVENLIMNKMQEQLTLDKASKHMRKKIIETRNKNNQLEHSVTEVNNAISHDKLQILNATTRVQNLKEILCGLNDAIEHKNSEISKVENEMVKKNSLIEKKQGKVDQLNKKIALLISKEGDALFAGPLEFQIKTLQNQIEVKVNESLELQQYWLRQQGELVKVLKTIDKQSKDVDFKKKQLTVIMQKKIRLEGEIDSQKQEIKDIERSVLNMQKDMTKLNILIYNNKDKKETLQQDNILLENHFRSKLKDAEMESVKMKNKIDALNEEKERLLNAVVEAERQIMLWEKKTQLAREVRETVYSDAAVGEMHALKTEVHRMEVRYAQLMRQQEKMVQDMEMTVIKRENIISKSDAQSKIDRNKVGKPHINKSTFQKKLSELKKSIRQANKEAEKYDEEIRQYREVQQRLGEEIESKQSDIHKIQQSVKINEIELEHLKDVKLKNLQEILTKQQRAKYYSSLKSGKYKPFCKTPNTLEKEEQKQLSDMQRLQSIIEQLNVEYPELRNSLRKARIMFNKTTSSSNLKEDS
ncbi:coiled-coil domain-containing protein 40 isoform X1 [Hydra vulgaris]|uniref:coiled-coil domain-containing protein 40 isoform X1 n=1 Tax=Hydra vulgaris TaxID=6087 RepID=UPI001F5FEF33|nr:coiled-coil domain-containing protein 40-like isoform X1 [Hydra vulgaris]